MRLTNKDVQDAVFTPFKDKEAVDYKPVQGEVVFTIRGEHDYMHEDLPALNDNKKVKAENRKMACAKKVGSRYYLKINGRGELFNPIDSNHTKTSDKLENNIPMWKYVNVAYTTFAHYAHFLKTRNQNYLTFARRDLGSTV